MKAYLLAPLTLGLTTLPALAQQPGYDHSRMMYGGYGYGEGMFLGPLFMVILLAILVVGIIALVRWTSGKPGVQDDGATSAIALLNQRLAKGEIDPKEYQERKALLQG